MIKEIKVTVELNSSTGDPMQLQYKLEEIMSSIKSSIDNERYYEYNKIVYNDWEDPHICELLINVKEIKND